MDGYLDVLVSTAADTVAYYLNQGNGLSFVRQEVPTGLPPGIELSGKALADLDGDQTNDLAFTAIDPSHPTSPQVYVVPNSGNPGAPFAAGAMTGIPGTQMLVRSDRAAWGSLTISYVNGDTKPDLVVLGNTGVVVKLLGQAGFGFSAPAAIGDVNAFSLGHRKNPGP